MFSGSRIGPVGGSCFVDDFVSCFFRPTPCGFRQVVQQLSKPVAIKINYLIRTGADAVVAAKVNWKRTDT